MNTYLSPLPSCSLPEVLVEEIKQKFSSVSTTNEGECGATDQDYFQLTAEAVLAALPQDLDLSSCRVGRWADDLAIVFARKAVELEPYAMQYRNHLASLLRKRGDFKSAEEAIREGLELNDEWSDGYIQLAIGKEGQAEFEEAISLSKKAMEISPHLMHHREHLCHLLTRTLQFDEALEIATDGVKSSPYWAIGHRRKALIHEAMGNLDIAIACAQDAITAAPYDLLFREHMCSLLRKQYDTAKAETAAREALEINPYWMEGHRQLSMVFDTAKDFQNTVAEAKIAVEGNPYELTFKAHLSTLLRRAGNIEEAVEAAQQGLDLNPYWGEGYRLKSLAHNIRGEHGPALEEARMAAQIEPYSFSLRAHLCNLLRENGEWEDASAAAKAGLDINPNWCDGYRQLSAIEDAHGKLDQAIELMREVVRIDPYTLGHRSYLCDLLRRTSKEEALSLAREGLALNPYWADGHRHISLVLEAEKQLAPAIAEIRLAVKLAPYNLGFRAHLCNLLRKKGDLDGVLNCAREGLAINPTWSEAHMQRAAVHDLRNQPRASIVEVRQAWRLSPEEGRCGNRLADMYRDLGELAKVINVVHEALNLNMWQSWAHRQLALVHETHGEISQAIYEARLAYSLAPCDRGCIELLVNLLIATNDSENINAILREVSKRLPSPHIGWRNALNGKFEKWLIEFHRTPITLINTALDLFHADEYDDAFAKIEEALEIAPCLAEAYELKSQMYVARNDMDSAIECAQKACELALDDLRFQDNLGEIYKRAGNIEALDGLSQNVLVRWPQAALGHRYASHVHTLRDEEDKALQSARLAFHLEPMDRKNCELLVEILAKRGNFDEAEEAVNVVIERSPESAWAYMLRAEIYISSGRIDESIKYIKNAIKIERDLHARRNHTVRLATIQGTEAVTKARIALLEMPHDRACVEQLCLALIRSGNATEVETIAQHELNETSNAGWIYRLLSLASCAKHDLKSATQLALKSIQLSPQDKDCVVNLIDLLCMQRLLDDAESIANAAAKRFVNEQWPHSQKKEIQNIRSKLSEDCEEYVSTV